MSRHYSLTKPRVMLNIVQDRDTDSATAWSGSLVVIVGLGGFLAYLVLSGMLAKRLSVHDILVDGASRERAQFG